MTAQTLRIEKFTMAGAKEWMDYSGVSLADVLNEDEMAGVKLGAVGFMYALKGAHTTFDFAYDEVLVVTKGRCTVRAEGIAVTASAGEVVFLPAGHSGSFETEEDTNLVYVASSPYGAANREAKESLLHKD